MANLLLMGSIGVETHHLFMMDHSEIVWYRVLHLGAIPYASMKFLPIITGILFGAAQFLPEMRDERFRLSLHLPTPIYAMVGGHIFFGLLALGIIILGDVASLGGIMGLYFPREGVEIALWTVLPWSMAGFLGYLGTALGLLEPQYRLKATLLTTVTAMAGLYLQQTPPGAYRPVIPELGLLLLLLLPGVFLPAYRFRFRRVSP